MRSVGWPTERSADWTVSLADGRRIKVADVGGVIGIGFDIGRMYIAHNESQVFTDAAALTAAQQLNGTHSGIGRARAAALAVPMKWNLGTRPFEGVVVEFSTDGKNWESDPVSPSAIMLARVTAPQNNLEIVFFSNNKVNS